MNERVLTFNAPNGAKVLRFDGPIGPRIVVSPLWAMSFNAACRRLCAAKVYPHRYRGGTVKKCMNNTDITPPPVISTAAGQPPIGKPLIVQARGQLRLTWRLYAESPQSGEISLRNVASPWWQEISRLCVSLEPKVFTTHTGRSPARDDDAGGQLTVIYRKGSH